MERAGPVFEPVTYPDRSLRLRSGGSNSSILVAHALAHIGPTTTAKPASRFTLYRTAPPSTVDSPTTPLQLGARSSRAHARLQPAARRHTCLQCSQCRAPDFLCWLPLLHAVDR